MSEFPTLPYSYNSSVPPCAVPPTVRADPADGNYVVKKGHRVELRCSASGNPHPSIRWSRKVS